MTVDSAATSVGSGEFCVLPWVSLATTVDGVWGRCCFDATNDYDHYYQQEDAPAFLLDDDAIGCLPKSRYAEDNPGRVFGLTEAFNAPAMRRTRLQMLHGERPAACGHCYLMDDTGAVSHRQRMNELFAGRIDVPALVQRTGDDGHLDEFPFYLDVRLGNACNLRCVMCSYPVSSRWAKDEAPAWARAHIDPYSNDAELWQQIEANVHQLRYLYLAGGEPFLQPGHARLMHMLIEASAAPEIELQYNSNLTHLPPGVFDLLSRFKKVSIYASCDGVGPVFETIRQGARWEVFVRNLHEAAPHCDLILDCTVQRGNIADIGNLVGFARAEGLPLRLGNFVCYPEHLSVRALSPAGRIAIRTDLEKLARKCDDANEIDIARQVRGVVTFMDAEPEVGDQHVG